MEKKQHYSSELWNLPEHCSTYREKNNRRKYFPSVTIA